MAKNVKRHRKTNREMVTCSFQLPHQNESKKILARNIWGKKTLLRK